MANAIDKGAVDAKLDNVDGLRISEDELQDARGMTTRWTGASVIWLRSLLTEIGMVDFINGPTTLYSDSSGAIDWMKFRKITPGNNYILLAYHQVGEFSRSGQILPVWKPGRFNCSDLLTKASSPQEIERLLRKFLGYDLIIQEEVDETVQQHGT